MEFVVLGLVADKKKIIKVTHQTWGRVIKPIEAITSRYTTS